MSISPSPRRGNSLSHRSRYICVYNRRSTKLAKLADHIYSAAIPLSGEKFDVWLEVMADHEVTDVICQITAEEIAERERFWDSAATVAQPPPPVSVHRSRLHDIGLKGV